MPTKATPTAVVADDERLMRDQLVTALNDAWPELAIVGQASNGREAIAMVRSLDADSLFQIEELRQAGHQQEQSAE